MRTIQNQRISVNLRLWDERLLMLYQPALLCLTQWFFLNDSCLSYEDMGSHAWLHDGYYQFSLETAA